MLAHIAGVFSSLVLVQLLCCSKFADIDFQLIFETETNINQRFINYYEYLCTAHEQNIRICICTIQWVHLYSKRIFCLSQSRNIISLPSFERHECSIFYVQLKKQLAKSLQCYIFDLCEKENSKRLLLIVDFVK